MNPTLEFYPEKLNEDVQYYVEFHQWEGSVETWTLFKRQYIMSKEDWEKQGGVFSKLPSLREGHPWNLGGGKICTHENVVDMNTKEFLKFMVDSLNKNQKNYETPNQNKNMLKLECEFPSEADMDFMEQAIQRHTGGFEPWWKEFVNNPNITGREAMRVIITIWEGGRLGKIPQKLKPHKQKKSSNNESC